jgi:KIF-1 binding protein C terminal
MIHHTLQCPSFNSQLLSLYLTLLGLLSGEEIRPFLNAHFMCCRALSKVISQADSKEGRAGHLVASLHRYDWLSKFGKQLCVRKGADLEDLFGAEMRICTDMVELLPSKIDRMHFRGESGLSI